MGAQRRLLLAPVKALTYSRSEFRLFELPVSRLLTRSGRPCPMRWGVPRMGEYKSSWAAVLRPFLSARSSFAPPSMGSAHSKAFVSDPARYATPCSSKSLSTDWKAFDYIIVGGGMLFNIMHIQKPESSMCATGTAGCVLASRLSEDPSVTVLLIEAGQRYFIVNPCEIFCFSFVQSYTSSPLPHASGISPHVQWPVRLEI